MRRRVTRHMLMVLHMLSRLELLSSQKLRLEWQGRWIFTLRCCSRGRWRQLVTLYISSCRFLNLFDWKLSLTKLIVCAFACQFSLLGMVQQPICCLAWEILQEIPFLQFLFIKLRPSSMLARRLWSLLFDRFTYEATNPKLSMCFMVSLEDLSLSR